MEQAPRKCQLFQFFEKFEKALEGGLEPPTLWLTATRSNQLSYSSCCWWKYTKLFEIVNNRKSCIP